MSDESAKQLPPCRLCGSDPQTWTIRRLRTSARCSGGGCQMRRALLSVHDWEVLMARTPLSPSREDELREAVKAILPLALYVGSEVGIWPAKVQGGNNDYSERNAEQDAHNLKVTTFLQGVVRLEKALRSTPPPPAKAEDEVRAEVWEEAGRVLPELGTGAGRDYAANKAADLRAGAEGRKG